MLIGTLIAVFKYNTLQSSQFHKVKLSLVYLNQNYNVKSFCIMAEFILLSLIL